MRTAGLIGQFVWFAIGSWFGSIVAIVAESLLRPRVPTDRDLPQEYLFVFYIPLCLIFAGLFIGWIAMRSRKSITRPVVIWPVPFVLGLLFFPALFVSIPLLIKLTGQGQGTLIGTSILTVMLGIPTMFAELSYQLGSRRNANSGNSGS